jgi:hypothetical protein
MEIPESRPASASEMYRTLPSGEKQRPQGRDSPDAMTRQSPVSGSKR